jgi:KaiC/GvpD/RAD55 family RecA-like ATPase
VIIAGPCERKKIIEKSNNKADLKVRKAVSIEVMGQVSHDLGVFRRVVRANMGIRVQIQRAAELNERPN